VLTKALLIVSFGVADRSSRKKTLDLYKKEVAALFPEYEVFCAFSSKRIIEKIAQREGMAIDDPHQALQRIFRAGYSKVLVSPFSLICGETFKKLDEYVQDFEGKFEGIKLVYPLLHKASDYQHIAKLITQDILLDSNQALVFVGHGTDSDEQESYNKLSEALAALDNQAFLGTIKNNLTVEIISEKLIKKEITTVILRPLLITSGHHVMQDINKIWTSGLASYGFKVEVDLKTLGEYEKIRRYFAHLIKE